MVFISLDFTGPDTPAVLQHGVLVRAPGFPEQGERTALGAKITVARNVRTISPPLRGGPWWAANGPSNDSGHRRAVIAVDGNVHVPERFATDWAKGGEDGELYKGDSSKNSSYYGYGAEVLAVADGVVTSVHDGIPENIPDSNTTEVPINLKTVAGNYIILDIGTKQYTAYAHLQRGKSAPPPPIGPRQYAFYAHLQPHSLRVKPGDVVHRGQVIALLGNSGNSEGPHLHFQISDSNSPLATEGIPYGLDSFELIGNLEGDKFVPMAKPKQSQRELPFENNIVIFP